MNEFILGVGMIFFLGGILAFFVLSVLAIKAILEIDKQDK